MRLIDHRLLAVLVSLSDLSAEEPTHTTTLAEIAQHSCVPASAVHERMARLAEGGFVSLQTLEV
ncbi:helix-turn-helix domain-containing protein [Teichococcus aestuarii]|uniref:helix-turn-helix domain-containing protein n=1 Tax=Teichococcus aestuarii TaxID=568898 RepID=UPI0036136B82